MAFRFIASKIPFIILLFGIFLVSCNTASDTSKNTDIADSSTTLSPLDSVNILLKKDRHNPDLWARRATIYFSNNHLDSAINDMSLAVSLDSLNADYQINLSQYYLLNAQSEKTKSILEKAAKQFPENKKIFLELGKLYLYVKDYKKAKEYFDHTLELDQSNAKAYYFKAIVATEENKPNIANRFLLAAVERNPDFYEAYALLGLNAFHNHDSLAIDYYKTACKIRPNSLESRYGLGMALQENNKPFEAVKEYEYITQNIDSTYTDAYYNIGYLILTESSHPLASKEYFQKVLALDSSRYDAWSNLGLVAKKQHDRATAIKYFKKALSLKPNFEPAVTNLNSIDK